MLPGAVLSSQVVQRGFIYPRNIPKRPLIDYEYGGVAINDGSQGLRVKVWKGEYIGTEIILSAPDVAPSVFLDVAGVTSFGFTFDQNMRPAAAYELEEGTSRFRWFDTTLGSYTTINLTAGTRTPRCCHDDNRRMQVTRGVSDMILAYMRAGGLYFRAQRDRFLVEYDLDYGYGDRELIQIGMNRGFRMQFMIEAG